MTHSHSRSFSGRIVAAAQRTWRETRRTDNRALYDLCISQFQLDAAIGRETVTP